MHSEADWTESQILPSVRNKAKPREIWIIKYNKLPNRSDFSVYLNYTENENSHFVKMSHSEQHSDEYEMTLLLYGVRRVSPARAYRPYHI